MTRKNILKNKSFFFYDSYERHRKIAELIGESKTILDVGGQLDALSQFSESKQITVANVAGSQEKSDVTLKGKKLPFMDDAFDCVCAIDVLEHIDSRERGSFIKELARVAKIKVVLSFPIGTPQHVAYETHLEKVLSRKGIDVTYLKEHIKYKLPTVEQIKSICKDFQYDLFYSGNIKLNKYLFSFFLFDPKIKLVRRSTYYAKLTLNALSNPILYSWLAKKPYTATVNRAYLVINKK